MSKGAYAELLRASTQKFRIMAMSIPDSEKGKIVESFTHRVAILGGYY